MIDLNKIWVEMACPKCGYCDAIQLVDAKTEKTIFCNNCKITIALSDKEASVHSNINSINNAFNELENIFKNLGK